MYTYWTDLLDFHFFACVYFFGNWESVGHCGSCTADCGQRGNVPIEMTPTFFQLIHPLLPFTYCIGAMREICFGVYWPSLVHDLVMMALLPILSLAVVVIFGPALRRFVEFFEHSMKKSGLM